MKLYSYFERALEIFERVLTIQKPLKSISSNYFRMHRQCGSTDRRNILNFVYGLTRYYLRLKNATKTENIKHLMIAYYILVEKKPIEDIFIGIGTATLNEEDIAFISSLPKNIDDLSECPEFLKNETNIDWKIFDNQPNAGILVNTSKTTANLLIQVFENEGITAEFRSEYNLSINKLPDITNNRIFKQGFFDIQDESSTNSILSTKSLSPKIIIDYCAGGGGKSLVLSLIHKEAKIIAHDTKIERMEDVNIRLKKFGLKEIETTTNIKINGDLVVVDAPCSATGTLGRHPELKLHLNKNKLDELIKTQKEILEKASEYVLQGGYLLYSTCSILNSENFAQVENFIKNNKKFELESSNIITPTIYNNGFYYALLKRIG